MVESYRDLKVWQRAIEMTLAIYRVTTGFPKVSVASNIAEGYGRGSKGEYKQFLAMARGSNLEVQTQLFLATKLGYGNSAQLKTADDLSNEVSKMLNSLLAKL